MWRIFNHRVHREHGGNTEVVDVRVAEHCVLDPLRLFSVLSVSSGVKTATGFFAMNTAGGESCTRRADAAPLAGPVDGADKLLQRHPGIPAGIIHRLRDAGLKDLIGDNVRS
jgi:hypothetical protein